MDLPTRRCPNPEKGKKTEGMTENPFQNLPSYVPWIRHKLPRPSFEPETPKWLPAVFLSGFITVVRIVEKKNSSNDRLNLT